MNVYGCSETLFLALAGNPDDTPLNSVGTLLPNVNGQLKDFSQESPSNDSIDQGGVAPDPSLHVHSLRKPRKGHGPAARQMVNSIPAICTVRMPTVIFFHLGREDDLIKVSGQWVYLAGDRNGWP